MAEEDLETLESLYEDGYLAENVHVSVRIVPAPRAAAPAPPPPAAVPIVAPPPSIPTAVAAPTVPVAARSLAPPSPSPAPAAPAAVDLPLDFRRSLSPVAQPFEPSAPSVAPIPAIAIEAASSLASSVSRASSVDGASSVDEAMPSTPPPPAPLQVADDAALHTKTPAPSKLAGLGILARRLPAPLAATMTPPPPAIVNLVFAESTADVPAFGEAPTDAKPNKRARVRAVSAAGSPRAQWSDDASPFTVSSSSWSVRATTPTDDAHPSAAATSSPFIVGVSSPSFSASPRFDGNGGSSKRSVTPTGVEYTSLRALFPSLFDGAPEPKPLAKPTTVQAWLAREHTGAYMREGKCFRCAAVGHVKADCPY